MVWVKQSSLSLSASLFCRLHRRAFCKKTLQPSTSWIRFRLTSLKGKSMGKHDPSNVLTSNATSSWEIWVSSQNFVRIFHIGWWKKTMKKIEIRNKHLANNISKRSLSKKNIPLKRIFTNYQHVIKFISLYNKPFLDIFCASIVFSIAIFEFLTALAMAVNVNSKCRDLVARFWRKNPSSNPSADSLRIPNAQTPSPRAKALENMICFFFWYGCFHKIGGKPPKWMVNIMENPIKMDDLGVPPFLETSISRDS